MMSGSFFPDRKDEKTNSAEDGGPSGNDREVRPLISADDRESKNKNYGEKFWEISWSREFFRENVITAANFFFFSALGFIITYEVGSYNIRIAHISFLVSREETQGL